MFFLHEEIFPSSKIMFPYVQGPYFAYSSRCQAVDPHSREVSVAEVVDFARHMNKVITSKEAIEEMRMAGSNLSRDRVKHTYLYIYT